VEREGGGFGGCVVDHRGRGEVAGYGGDGNDHAVVGGDHGGQELLRQIVVAEGVDLEGEVDVLLCRLEDRFAACDSSVVDQDRGVTECGADGRGGGGDGLGVGEIAFEEADG